MNSTIVLSSQRSGSTFLVNKLNGMCSSSGGGEIAFEKSFITNKIEHLINCNKKEYNRKTDVKVSKPKIYKDCFYRADYTTMAEIVNKSKSKAFKVQLNQINFNIPLIKEIKTPILFLIRKNQWKRGISQYLANKKILGGHVKKNIETINVEIKKTDLIKICNQDIDIIRNFQKGLRNQKNVKILYYEDIENKEYWTTDFIDELESFMQIKFTDRNYYPLFKKTRNFVDIINEKELIGEECLTKYYINEI